jgi:hypothetical protein
VVDGVIQLHIQNIRNLYSSPNNNRTMKSRRMRWAEHVAHMAEMINS